MTPIRKLAAGAFAVGALAVGGASLAFAQEAPTTTAPAPDDSTTTGPDTAPADRENCDDKKGTGAERGADATDSSA